MLKVEICAHDKNEYKNGGDLHSKYNKKLVAIHAHNFNSRKLTNLTTEKCVDA